MIIGIKIRALGECMEEIEHDANVDATANTTADALAVFDTALSTLKAGDALDVTVEARRD